MNEQHPSELVIAQVGDRTFVTPTPMHLSATNGLEDTPPTWELNARVDVIDGAPMFREITLVCHEPMRPVDVQRFPWGKALEWAIEANARDEDGRSGYRDVRDERQKAAGRERARRRSQEITASGQGKERRTITDDLLRQVLEIRERELAKGGRSWAAAAGRELGYAPAYVRQLAMRARRELGED